MSDTPAAVPPPNPAPAKATRPVRKPTGAVPPPPPRPDKLKKTLVVSIVVGIAVLGPLAGMRIYRHFHPPKGTEIVDVNAESTAAWRAAQGARGEIEKIEKKVWDKNEALTPEDNERIKAERKKLIDAEASMKSLLDLLAKERKENSQDGTDILRMWMETKIWILDANDVLAESKPPEYGGLYIPMYRAVMKWQSALKELKELESRRDAILEKNDPAEREKASARAKELEELFQACSEKLQALNVYVQQGTARDNLSIYKLKDLELLAEEANQSMLAKGQARTLKGQLR